MRQQRHRKSAIEFFSYRPPLLNRNLSLVVGISSFGLQGLTVRHKVPLLESPQPFSEVLTPAYERRMLHVLVLAHLTAPPRTVTVAAHAAGRGPFRACDS